jgi:hypothetical protein
MLDCSVQFSFVRGLLAGLVLIGCAYGSSITTSVTCVLWGLPSTYITGTSHCDAGTPPPLFGPPPPYITASASASLQLSNTADGWVTVNLATSIFGTDAAAYLEDIGQLPPNYTYASSAGSATAQLHFDLYTDGPSRIGIFQVRQNPALTGFAVGTNDAAGAGAQLALYDGSPFPFTVTCSSNFGCSLPGPSAPVFYYSLGSPISVDASSEAFTETPFGNSYASTNVSIQFRFLEADGITPVVINSGIPVSAVPEPGTFSLYLIMGALMALTKSKKYFIGLTCDDCGQKKRCGISGV